jgi:hypothetical protein
MEAPQKTQLHKYSVIGNAFEPVHSQKDYSTDSVTIQFKGKFDYQKAIEYMLQSYPSFKGREIVDLSEPSEFRGLENLGSVVFQHCP